MPALRYVETKQTSTGYRIGGHGPGAVTLIEVRDIRQLAAVAERRRRLRRRTSSSAPRPPRSWRGRTSAQLNPGGSFSDLRRQPHASRAATRSSSRPRRPTTTCRSNGISRRESALVVGLFYKDISSFVADDDPADPVQPARPAGHRCSPARPCEPTDLFTVTQPVEQRRRRRSRASRSASRRRSASCRRRSTISASRPTTPTSNPTSPIR